MNTEPMIRDDLVPLRLTKAAANGVTSTPRPVTGRMRRPAVRASKPRISSSQIGNPKKNV